MHLFSRRPVDDGITTNRIEAFSDGVFAIAITLLILQIQVPRKSADLMGSLLHLWPAYGAYLLSFITIGIYWANHHSIFQHYVKTDHAFNMLNVLFLLVISFVPFPTAVLATHINDPASFRDSVAFYSFGMLMPAIMWNVLWLYASIGYHLLDSRLAPSFVKANTTQFMITVAVYFAAFVLALFWPSAGLAVVIGMTVLYLLPPRQPVYKVGASSPWHP